MNWALVVFGGIFITVGVAMAWPGQRLVHNLDEGALARKSRTWWLAHARRLRARPTRFWWVPILVTVVLATCALVFLPRFPGRGALLVPLAGLATWYGLARKPGGLWVDRMEAMENDPERRRRVIGRLTRALGVLYALGGLGLLSLGIVGAGFAHTR